MVFGQHSNDTLTYQYTTLCLQAEYENIFNSGFDIETVVQWLNIKTKTNQHSIENLLNKEANDCFDFTGYF